ncbi:MAG: CotH kinase family protein [Deltaproteobacteria bacterium]|nr:CotH kinase family protein [Deltaproteobacteria bacterium]
MRFPSHAGFWSLALVSVSTAVLVGCVTDVPLDDAAWPTERQPLPACETPWTRPFAVPDAASPTGDVLADVDVMQPVGAELRMRIEVLDGGELDADFDGAVGIVASPPGLWVELDASASGGVVEVRYRLDQPGLVSLSLSVDDGRTGSAQLFGFESQLPLWRLETTAEDWQTLRTSASGTDRVRVPVGLEVDGEAFTGTVRLHGGSSVEFSKKSFRIDLGEDDDGEQQVLPSGSDHLILRAEYADKTMLRNWLSFDVARNGTWLPASRIQPVHLRVNGAFYGLMMHTERVDADWLERRGLDRDGQLYEADPPLALSSPGGNLTPQPDLDTYQQVYQHHRGTIEYEDLVGLIEDRLSPEGVEYGLPPGEEIAVSDLLAYTAVMSVVQNQDHLRKNYYLYRDRRSADESRWQAVLWDMDLTWGHLWTAENDVLDEGITWDGPVVVGDNDVIDAFDHNALLHRVLLDDDVRDTLHDYILHLAYDVADPTFVEERLANVLCRITPEVLADRRKRASNDEYLGRVDEITQFLAGRVGSITEELDPTRLGR